VKDAKPPEQSGREALQARDERALVDRLVSRDQAALGELHDRYARVVYAMALKISGSPGEAEDVTIDTFWQVWQQANRYDPVRGSVGAWICTIARSRALDRLRTQRRSPLIATDEPPERADLTIDEDPEQDVFLAERSAIVRSALRELSDSQREAIELAFYHGLSHAEIADRLNEPLGTIKTRIRLGLSKMRDRMAAHLKSVRA
jgi:RNA polymerase sigma-70 factor (ECF subfamily)